MVGRCPHATGTAGTAAAPNLTPTTQVELNLAKPNYRHQKKQKEQARKLRQAEKQNRRLAARADGTDGAADGEAGGPALPGTVTPEQAGS